jgi:hypothetical protein
MIDTSTAKLIGTAPFAANLLPPQISLTRFDVFGYRKAVINLAYRHHHHHAHGARAEVCG